MNWGKITVLILVSFVLFIGALSYKMAKSPNDEYDHQYYEDGLSFDHDYVREKLAIDDHAQPTIQIETGAIKFTFPQLIKGTVKFSRPSSDAADQTFTIDNSNSQAVALFTKNMVKGRWQLVFDWKSNNKSYLYQQEVDIR